MAPPAAAIIWSGALAAGGVFAQADVIDSGAELIGVGAVVGTLVAMVTVIRHLSVKQVDSLSAQLAKKDEQLATKDRQIIAMMNALAKASVDIPTEITHVIEVQAKQED